MSLNFSRVYIFVSLRAKRSEAKQSQFSIVRLLRRLCLPVGRQAPRNDTLEGVITKVFYLFIVFLLQTSFAFAQFVADYTTEEQTRTQLSIASGENTRAVYSYDSYQYEKDLIFKQLSVITGDEESRYIIAPGDTLTISYMDRGVAQGAVYKVTGDGMIYMPLLGAVKVVGLSRRQVRGLISELLEQYIRNPGVDISVNTAGRIMVLGEVTQPGLYVIRPNFTVMEAILTAGSYDKDTANLRSVMLMRGGLDKPEVKRLNLRRMITHGDRKDDYLVKPGDIIFVPKTFISNIKKFKDTIYDYVNAYYAYGRLPAPTATEENQPVLYENLPVIGGQK